MATDLLEQIRGLIRDSGESLNEIARGSGVDVAVLSRLMRKERETTVRNCERLATYFDAEIVVKPKGRKGKR